MGVGSSKNSDSASGGRFDLDKIPLPFAVKEYFENRKSTIDPGRLRSSWNVHNEVNYRWRERALCTSHWKLADETRGRDISKEDLRKKVQSCLSSKAFRTKPPHGPKKYVKWMQKRINLLTKTGGPRMRVVWWKTLADLGRIPRWPEDKQHILDLETVLDIWLKECDSQGRMDGRYLYIWMLSHRWERPHFCDECLTGFCELMSSAHPDSITNVKARTMSRWGEHQYDEGNVGPLSPEDHYIWIDFTSIDQEDSVQKLLGIEMLPLYVACCGSGLVLYLPDNEEIGYEERGWTAIERVLAYTYGVSPVLKKIDSGYCKGASRWTSKKLIAAKPEYWEENGDGALCFRLIDPLKGRLTCEQDIPKIEHLKEIIETTAPIDFHGTKTPLEWNKTLCRVDDTCRERSTVMQRGGRKGESSDGRRASEAPANMLDRIMAFNPRSALKSFKSYVKSVRCCCLRRADNVAPSARRSTRIGAARASTFAYTGDGTPSTGSGSLNICVNGENSSGFSSAKQNRIEVLKKVSADSSAGEDEDTFDPEDGKFNQKAHGSKMSIVPTSSTGSSGQKKSRKVSFMQAARPGLTFNNHVDGAGMLKVEGYSVTKKLSTTVFESVDGDDACISSTNSMDWCRESPASSTKGSSLKRSSREAQKPKKFSVESHDSSPETSRQHSSDEVEIEDLGCRNGEPQPPEQLPGSISLPGEPPSGSGNKVDGGSAASAVATTHSGGSGSQPDSEDRMSDSTGCSSQTRSTHKHMVPQVFTTCSSDSRESREPNGKEPEAVLPGCIEAGRESESDSEIDDSPAKPPPDKPFKR